ncbi:MAG: ABC transporter substrate-binding protein [Erysipelotrichaceae bacterium]
MKIKRIINLLMILFMIMTLASCKNENIEEEYKEHEPVTIMSAGRDYTGFIEYVKSVYPEINIEIIPYRGANTTQYMYDQLVTGYMPDIYSTTQMFTCYEAYEENLIDLSKYGFTNNYNDARISQFELDGKIYLLPADYDVLGMRYNASLFEREGWKVPESFSELEELAPKIISAGYDLCESDLSLPGYGFQYMCNIADTLFLRTIEGIKWQRDFINGKQTAKEGLASSFEYIQRWVDLGMFASTDKPADKFKEGSTAFYIGSFWATNTRDDGTGDVIKPMPYLSYDGSSNTFISSTVRCYGLNKKLLDKGNEQKFEDALKIMELMSNEEGMAHLMERYGQDTVKAGSLKGFKMSKNSPYYEYSDFIAQGNVAPLLYAGYEDVMVETGNKFISYVKGECTKEDVLSLMDETKIKSLSGEETVYASIKETLSVDDLAKLTGMVFCDKTGADLALISLNESKPGVSSRKENTKGIGASMMPIEMKEMDIVCWLPTGWYGTICTYSFSGSRIKELLNTGYDFIGDGNTYPYVLVTPDDFEIEDDTVYEVYFAGITDDVAGESIVKDSGITGLESMKDYLLLNRIEKPSDIVWERPAE